MKLGFVDIQDENFVRKELSPVYAVSLQETVMSVLDSLVLSAIFLLEIFIGDNVLKSRFMGHNVRGNQICFLDSLKYDMS